MGANESAHNLTGQWRNLVVGAKPCIHVNCKLYH